MDEKVAQRLVRSFLSRLVRDAGRSFRLPEGLLSLDEVDALHVLIGDPLVGGAGSGLLPRPISSFPPNEVQKPVPATPLNRSALSSKGPEESSLRLCLDFGTALSKAWATGAGVNEALPLALGRPAANRNELALPSAVYIGRNGHVYLGFDADRRFRQDPQPGRSKFDNLKRLLSEVEVGDDLDARPLRPGIDPTDSGLHEGDLLVLYLAWMTDMSLRALSDAVAAANLPVSSDPNAIRYVRRRFAIPCFADAVDETVGGHERAAWALDTLRRMILRAQVVADTLSGQWDRLTVEMVRQVTEEVRTIDVGDLQHLLAETEAIREPIAAGASRFSDALDVSAQSAPTGHVRLLLMVVDAGAGTTDFAVFQAVYQPEEYKYNYTLLKRSIRMSRIAGNAVDELLRPEILSACGIDPKSGHPRSDEDFSYLKADLAAQIRDIKRELFDKATVSVSLKPNAQGQLTLEQIEANNTYVRYGEELKSIRDEILRSVLSQPYLDHTRLMNERSGKPVPVYMLLTGGSAALPIVQRLADGESAIKGARFAFRRVSQLPAWVDRLPRDAAELVASVYPQAAVAIGGAAPELPEETADQVQVLDPRPRGTAILERVQIRGV